MAYLELLEPEVVAHRGFDFVHRLEMAEAVAVPLGGGGHACAAGVTLDMPVDAALQKALELAARAIEGDS